jgi:hypothetical protein
MMSGNNFNFTVYLVNYNDQEDKSGLDEWRFVRAGGALESTNTPNNIRIGSCRVNDSVTLEFRRYENESPFRRSLSPFSIMMGKGRATRFNINVGGKPITVAVETDTPVPGEANWPKKNDLINSLQ